MTGRVQTLRSSVSGNRPTGRQPGELYVNWADQQLGVINASNAAQDLLAVRFFSAQANYSQGNYVVQAGNLYSANAAITAGAFNAANWTLVGGNVVVSDNPPATPNNGQLWWDSAGGNLYVWYTDANSSQWVVVVNNGPPASSSLPIMDSVAAVGTSSAWARGDHVHPSDTSLLPLSGGTMTGNLTVPNIIAPQAMNDNRIINGDMRIDQRNNGAAVSPTSGTYTVDRWTFSNNTGAARGAVQRITSASALISQGFGYYLVFTSSSAYTPAAADNVAIYQSIEADMIADFAWGTVNAQPVTLSFWIATTQAGTFGGSIKNYAGTRSYPFSFNSAAAGWQKIVVTIPGDTAGTWVLQGNGGGAYVLFSLGMGSNFLGPANAWASANYSGVTGAVSVTAVNGAVFQLTGVKLEIGSVATSFNRPPLAQLLLACQRYYWQPSMLFTALGYNNAGGNVLGVYTFPVTMRAVPTIVTSNVSYSNASGLATSAYAECMRATAVITATNGGYCNFNANFSAEL